MLQSRLAISPRDVAERLTHNLELLRDRKHKKSLNINLFDKAWKEREVVFPFETNNLKLALNNVLMCLPEKWNGNNI